MIVLIKEADISIVYAPVSTEVPLIRAIRKWPSVELQVVLTPAPWAPSGMNLPNLHNNRDTQKKEAQTARGWAFRISFNIYGLVEIIQSEILGSKFRVLRVEQKNAGFLGSDFTYS